MRRTSKAAGHPASSRAGWARRRQRAGARSPVDDTGATGSVTRVTVLLPTYRRPAHLARALDGLARQTRPPDEVLVVVRADDPESRLEAERPRDLALRTVPVVAPGLVAARNAGLDAATGDVVAFLDDDAVPEAAWLERMIDHYTDPTVGAVGGRDRILHGGVPVDGRPLRVVGVLSWYGKWVAMHHRGEGPARDVHHLKGVNMSFRRSRYPDVRVDAALRGYGAQVHEESSLVLQVRGRGGRIVYDPNVLVDHFEADRGSLDARQPRDLRARRDRQHNQTYVVWRYFPTHRALVHLLYAVLVGTSDAPGLLASLRGVALRRTLRGVGGPLLANLVGRCEGVVTALREARRHGSR